MSKFKVYTSEPKDPDHESGEEFKYVRRGAFPTIEQAIALAESIHKATDLYVRIECNRAVAVWTSDGGFTREF